MIVRKYFYIEVRDLEEIKFFVILFIIDVYIYILYMKLNDLWNYDIYFDC